jgi:hypothetical protein
MVFQQAASDRISTGLKAKEKGEAVVVDLNRMFKESQRSGIPGRPECRARYP